MSMKNLPCTEPGCDSQTSFAKRLCQRHYTAARRNGDPRLKTNGPCIEPECVSPASVKNYCDIHYAKAKRHGILKAPRCSIYGCSGAASSLGLCQNHYLKRRRLIKLEALRDELQSDDRDLEKACCKCGVIKPHPEFYKRRSVASGRSSWCRQCIRASGAVRRYELTWVEAYALAGKTDCVSCGDPIPMTKGAAIDHCHKTGRARDVLCHACNSALGLLREDPVRMRALIAYIEKWNQILGVEKPDA